MKPASRRSCSTLSSAAVRSAAACSVEGATRNQLPTRAATPASAEPDRVRERDRSTGFHDPMKLSDRSSRIGKDVRDIRRSPHRRCCRRAQRVASIRCTRAWGRSAARSSTMRGAASTAVTWHPARRLPGPRPATRPDVQEPRPGGEGCVLDEASPIASAAVTSLCGRCDVVVGAPQVLLETIVLLLHREKMVTVLLPIPRKAIRRAGCTSRSACGLSTSYSSVSRWHASSTVPPSVRIARIVSRSVDLPVPSGFLVQQDRPRFGVNSGNVRARFRLMNGSFQYSHFVGHGWHDQHLRIEFPAPKPSPPVLLRPPPRHERGTAPVEPRCNTSAKHRRPYRPARPRLSAADRPRLRSTSSLPQPSARPASVRPWRAGRPSSRSRDSFEHGGEAVRERQRARPTAVFTPIHCILTLLRSGERNTRTSLMTFSFLLPRSVQHISHASVCQRATDHNLGGCAPIRTGRSFSTSTIPALASCEFSHILWNSGRAFRRPT